MPPHQETDTELIRRFQAGDSRAFAELYHRHAPALYGVALRLLRNRAAAEDALQNTFVKLHRALPEFRFEAGLGTFLHRILVNCCRDQLRRDRWQLVGEDEMPEITVRSSDSELRIALEEAMARLPERMRTAFSLFAVEGWPLEEIAAAMGISMGGVKATLFQARKRLRLWLGGRPLPANRSIKPGKNQRP